MTHQPWFEGHSKSTDQRRVIVFLGPSLSKPAAQSIYPDATYLPPAACGDVLRAIRLRPSLIAIIDGLFESTPSVWHKEILLALENGIQVVGASSMGALRAAELAEFGMQGFGRIFEQYQCGALTDDDEVAVLHGPPELGSLVLTDALVNIRATLDAAIDAGIVTPSIVDEVLASAKATFYWERRLRDICQHATAANPANRHSIEELLLWCERGNYVDLKKQDARGLLAELHRMQNRSNSRPPRVSVHRTVFLRSLSGAIAVRPLPWNLPELPLHERVARHARYSGHVYLGLRRLASILGVIYSIRTRQHANDPQTSGCSGTASSDGSVAVPAAWAEENDVAPCEIETTWRRLTMAMPEAGRPNNESATAYATAFMRLDGIYVPELTSSNVPCAASGELTASKLYELVGALWQVIEDAAAARHLAMTPTELQARADSFRRVRGMNTKASTQLWMKNNELDDYSFSELIRIEWLETLLTDVDNCHAMGGGDVAWEGVSLLRDALCLSGAYAILKASLLGLPNQSCAWVDTAIAETRDGLRKLSGTARREALAQLDFAPNEEHGMVDFLHPAIVS